MPSLGADMEAATLVRWFVQPGDAVKRGQIVAEVETDKGALDVEIFEDGVVEELVAREGERAVVGAVLARIAGAGSPAGAAIVPAAEPVAVVPVTPPAAAPVVSPAPAVPPPPPASTVPAAPRAGRPRSSPAARVLAETAGIDLDGIGGTGPGGAVTRDDVQRAIDARPTAPSAPQEPAAPPAPREQATETAVARRTPGARAAMRASISALMSRSKREIPHYYLSTEIDLTRLRAWLDATNAARAVSDRLLPAALLLRAVARAVKAVPEVNGFLVDGTFTPSAAVHVGVAISLKDAGLVAPAILDAERKSVDELMAALKDLVARARTGRLRASEMSSPTITVTNLGDQGVDSVFGVIYPPQVAIVGFGRIAERPPGIPGARPGVVATLAADHRVSDGHRGALFLAALDRLLQKPEEP
jgi:pyruvate dehydrogenase E2 component (dihydrolipoamide acetyltransferase)